MVKTHGKLFDIPADSVVNRHLKEIWYEVKMSPKLSFHSARHTFAMLFLDAGGKVEVLQSILGHSKIDTTMEYVHLRNDAARDQIMQMDNKQIIIENVIENELYLDRILFAAERKSGRIESDYGEMKIIREENPKKFIVLLMNY